MATYIYLLREPDTSEVRYVGKADDPSNRTFRNRLEPKGRLSHLEHAKKLTNKTHKDCWIRKLLKEDKLPILDVILEVHKSDWQFWEKEFIKTFRSQGYNLVNHASGGEGGMTSEISKRIWETRRKNGTDKFTLPFKARGRYSKEHCEAISLAKKGKPSQKPSEETLDKMRLAKLGKKQPKVSEGVKLWWAKRKMFQQNKLNTGKLT